MWTVRLSEDCRKEFKKLDRAVQKRVLHYLYERVSASPRQLGKALTGDKRGYWRYRVGDYRIIAQIQDEKLLVLAVRIAKRADVYKKSL